MSEIEENRQLIVRPANEDDVTMLMQFVQAIADFENLGNHVVSTEASLRENLFGKKPYAEAVIAELGNEPVGFALFFHNFSSFLGRPGLYIEDLYVCPQYRNSGVGKALMKHCAQVAIERDCVRMDWNALDWNPARKFYERLGAQAHTEWIMYRLEGMDLFELADE